MVNKKAFSLAARIIIIIITIITIITITIIILIQIMPFSLSLFVSLSFPPYKPRHVDARQES